MLRRIYTFRTQWSRIRRLLAKGGLQRLRTGEKTRDWWSRGNGRNCARIQVFQSVLPSQPPPSLHHLRSQAQGEGQLMRI